MREREQYQKVIRAAFCAVLLFLDGRLFRYVWMHYYSPLMETVFFRRGHWLVLSLYLIFLFAFIGIYGGWKAGYHRIVNLISSHALGLLIANVLSYIEIVALTKKMVSVLPLSCLFVLEMLISLVWSIVCTRLYRMAYPPHRVLLIYEEKPDRYLLDKLKSRGDRISLAAEISLREGMEAVLREMEQYSCVLIYDIPSRERNYILKQCYRRGIRCYLTPKLSDILIRSAENQHLFDTPLYLCRNSSLTIERAFFKRLTDILISALGLLFFSPIMLLIALFIRFEDRGPVIYQQERLTKDGRHFHIYKFRSMREDAERDGRARLAEKDDERITAVGRFIRPFRLDELPQLWNILLGEMSLVGPRPERPDIAAAYEEEIPEFSYRLKVKAGLTGYAQVYGKYNTTAYDKLKLDLMYIQNGSLMMDMEILLKTVQILFQRESAEGVQAEDRQE